MKSGKMEPLLRLDMGFVVVSSICHRLHDLTTLSLGRAVSSVEFDAPAAAQITIMVGPVRHGQKRKEVRSPDLPDAYCPTACRFFDRAPKRQRAAGLNHSCREIAHHADSVAGDGRGLVGQVATVV